MELFRARGYAGVSMDDIARAAQLTKATLYYHFPGKSDVFVAGVQLSVEIVRGYLQQIFAQRNRSVRERLMLLLEGRREHMTAIMSEDRMFQEALNHLSDGQQRVVLEAKASMDQPTRDLMAEGIERGELRPIDPAVLAHAWHGLTSFTVYAEFNNTLHPAIDRELVAIFFEGAGV
jgi:AcrR family transcriptional regulator